MRHRAFAAAAAVALCAGAPAAADTEPSVTVAVGVDATTDYVFRGESLSSNSPAIQPYLEVEASGFYAGIWGSNVRLAGRNDFEYDLYAGYRNEIGPFSYDVGYVRYLLVRDGDCCGEAYARFGWQATEALGLSAEVHRDFPNDTTYGAIGISFAGPYGLEFSAGLGRIFEFREFDWNLGVSRPINDWLSADLRYHQAESGDALVVFTLSAAADWSGLAAGGASRPAASAPARSRFVFSNPDF